MGGARQEDPRGDPGLGGRQLPRNRGLKEARGRYVAFLDSDNRWRPDFLRLAVAAMHGQGLRAAYAAMALHEDERTRYRAHPYTYDDLLVHNFVDPNVLVVERDLAGDVGGFDEELRRWVDHDFALRSAARRPAAAAVRGCRLRRLAHRHRTDHHQRVTELPVRRARPAVGRLGRGRGCRGRPGAGRLSVIVPAHDDARLTRRAVRSVLKHTPDIDLEVVVVDSGSAASVGLTLAAEFLTESRVRYERLPRDLRVTVGWNLGFARSTGEHVAFLSPRAAVRPGWWEPLARRLTEPWVLGVQALVLNDDDTIRSAGLVFPVGSAAPCSYLEGHPPEDAAKIADLGFHAVSAEAMALRATDLAELRGFDPLFSDWLQDVDLCLRAAARREGRFVLEPGSRVNVRPDEDLDRRFETDNRRHFHARWRGRLPAAENHRWTKRASRSRTTRARAQRSPPATGRDALGHPQRVNEAPALRWGVVIAAVGGGAGGDAWGDTHFAGHSRPADRPWPGRGHSPARCREGRASRFDDVVLGLRGLKAVHPFPADQRAVGDQPPRQRPGRGGAGLRPGVRRVRALGAPDERQPAAAGGGDAAGHRRPPRRRPVAGRHGGRPVFVGGTNPRRPRQVGADAVAAGVALDVHGIGWAGTPAEPDWRSAYVANEELMPLYRSHGMVLADHWGDMAREGLPGQPGLRRGRLGRPVASDPVPGSASSKAPCRRTPLWRSAKTLCGPAGRDRFPTDEEMAVIADRVATEHSFDRRAADLLRAVAAVREERLTLGRHRKNVRVGRYHGAAVSTS